MSITLLERMGCRPFSSTGQAIFSLLSAEPEGNKQEEAEEKEAEHDMVTFHLVKPTCSTPLLLLEFLLEQQVLKE
jgi:hypothetical protein